MSALDLLKKVKVQTLSFEKHPCRALEQEQMIHYLNGLALLTNEDDDISEKEKEYLAILINSFGLSEDMIETFEEFAQNPDEHTILDMMQSFATKDIKYNFMIDCMMIASVDGCFDDAEKAVIAQYMDMFKITAKEAQDLTYLYEILHTQDGNALYRYFKRNEYMPVERFQYFLDYYHIDMAYELIEDEKKILNFGFFKPTFENGKLGKNATEIMSNFVNNAQFGIYLNSAFMVGHIEFDGNGKIVHSKSKALLMDLEKSAIKFEKNTFTVGSEEDEGIEVTGMTYVMAENFIIWINEHYPDDEGKVYKFIKFGEGGWNVTINDFNMSELLFEFIDSEHYGMNVYTRLHNNGTFALDRDGGPRTPSKTSCFENIGFRMMR